MDRFLLSLGSARADGESRLLLYVAKKVGSGGSAPGLPQPSCPGTAEPLPGPTTSPPLGTRGTPGPVRWTSCSPGPQSTEQGTVSLPCVPACCSLPEVPLHSLLSKYNPAASKYHLPAEQRCSGHVAGKDSANISPLVPGDVGSSISPILHTGGRNLLDPRVKPAHSWVLKPHVHKTSSILFLALPVFSSVRSVCTTNGCVIPCLCI